MSVRASKAPFFWDPPLGSLQVAPDCALDPLRTLIWEEISVGKGFESFIFLGSPIVFSSFWCVDGTEEIE